MNTVGHRLDGDGCGGDGCKRVFTAVTPDAQFGLRLVEHAKSHAGIEAVCHKLRIQGLGFVLQVQNARRLACGERGQRLAGTGGHFTR